MFFCLVLMCLRKERGMRRNSHIRFTLEGKQPRGRRMQRESPNERQHRHPWGEVRAAVSKGTNLMRAIRTRASGRKEGEGIWEAPK
jgi:hypothetical protein